MSRFNLKSKLQLVRKQDIEREREKECVFDFLALSVDYCVFPANRRCI